MDTILPRSPVALLALILPLAVPVGHCFEKSFVFKVIRYLGFLI